MNHVEMRGEVVIKTFDSVMAFDRERELYVALMGSDLSPEVQCIAPRALWLTRIDGIVFADVPPNVDGFRTLARWYVEMEKAVLNHFGYHCVLEDGNFHNFIRSKGRIAGIDFERWHRGTLVEAFAVPLARVITMDCSNDELRARILWEMRTIFCQAGVNMCALMRAMDEEVARLRAWRQVMPILRHTTAGILMGGEGRRFGGENKAQVKLGKYTLLERIEDALEVFDHLCYSVRATSERPTGRGRVVVDTCDAGAAAGLCSLLESCETKFLFVWSCDMPLITRDFILRMFLDFDPMWDGLIPVVAGRRYPLSAIYATDIGTIVRVKMEAGERKIINIVRQCNVVDWNIPTTERALCNINERAQLESLMDEDKTTQEYLP